MPTLEPGDRAPAITLNDQHGKKVKLADFAGRNLVVYFYPKADTPGCTTQSCALRDAEPDLKKLKSAVVGISQLFPPSVFPQVQKISKPSTSPFEVYRKNCKPTYR